MVQLQQSLIVASAVSTEHASIHFAAAVAPPPPALKTPPPPAAKAPRPYAKSENYEASAAKRRVFSLDKAKTIAILAPQVLKHPSVWTRTPTAARLTLRSKRVRGT